VFGGGGTSWGASFGLFRGEKVGITGENGSGKSTLLELVRGTLHADAGVFEMPGNLVMAHVSQDIEATDQPAIEFVLDGTHALRAIKTQGTMRACARLS
jgi:ATP-binding cassette subfamily F protein 3